MSERRFFRSIILCFQCSERRRPRCAENRRSPYAYAGASISTLLYDGLHFCSCAMPFRLPIVVSWHATKTTSASVPARSAIVVAGGQARAGSARRADARPASSARSIGRSGGPAATPNRLTRHREGRRPVQCAGPGRCNGADAQGSERVEPGRERGAHAGAAGGGEGPRGEAQPAARSRPRTAVCQRQGGGRAPALSRTRRRDEGWREGPGLFGRARRGGWPRFPRSGPRGPPPVPLHRLGRGRRGAVRPARRPPAI